MTWSSYDVVPVSSVNGTAVQARPIAAQRNGLATAVATLERHPQAQSEHIRKLVESLTPLDGYKWCVNEHHEKAVTWLTAARAARTANELWFFVNAIVDIYHFDRATDAANRHNLPEPIKQSRVPQDKVKKKESTRYQLTWYKLNGVNDAPHDAVTAVAEVLLDTPPDDFEVADYVAIYKHWDPIIYARYGPWCVELARWK